MQVLSYSDICFWCHSHARVEIVSFCFSRFASGICLLQRIIAVQKSWFWERWIRNRLCPWIDHVWFGHVLWVNGFVCVERLKRFPRVHLYPPSWSSNLNTPSNSLANVPNSKALQKDFFLHQALTLSNFATNPNSNSQVSFNFPISAISLSSRHANCHSS